MIHGYFEFGRDQMIEIREGCLVPTPASLEEPHEKSTTVVRTLKCYGFCSSYPGLFDRADTRTPGMLSGYNQNGTPYIHDVTTSFGSGTSRIVSRILLECPMSQPAWWRVRDTGHDNDGETRPWAWIFPSLIGGFTMESRQSTFFSPVQVLNGTSSKLSPAALLPIGLPTNTEAGRG
jgi:hypothetical protein